MNAKHQTRATGFIIGIIVVIGLLAIVAGGLAKEPACGCAEKKSTEVYVRLSPDIQFPSILTRCTGYVRLYSNKTSTVIKLLDGRYFLDFKDIEGLSSLCTDCALEGEHDCQATEVKYEVSIDGEEKAMGERQEVKFSIDATTKTPTLITIVIEYKCADTTTADLKCNTASCKQTLYFRFARAGTTCDCSAVGFTATILKNNTPMASTTYLPILNPPSGTTDLYIEYEKSNTAAAVGAAAPRLAKGDTIEIRISDISVLCLCRDTVCPNSDDDPNVSLSKGTSTLTKTGAAWTTDHTVYQGLVEIKGDPSKASVYVTVTYRCLKTENCKGRIHPRCSRTFELFLRPEA